MEKFSCNIKIFSLCLLSIAILVIFVPQIFLFPHITDDAYISFRYATRLAEGHGLTFNPGEWVEGFSNPLWTLLISVIIRLTPFAAPDIARWLGLLCTILTIITIWRIFHKNGIKGYEGRSNFIVCATIVLLNPGFHPRICDRGARDALVYILAYSWCRSLLIRSGFSPLFSSAFLRLFQYNKAGRASLWSVVVCVHSKAKR